MRHYTAQGLSESTINNTLVSAVADMFRYDPVNAPTHGRQVKDAKAVVRMLTPPPRHTTRVPRWAIAKILMAMAVELNASSCQLVRLRVLRDICMFLCVYKVFARPSSVVKILSIDIDILSLQLHSGVTELVASFSMRNGKNFQGRAHTALVAAGSDPLFNLVSWLQAYLTQCSLVLPQRGLGFPSTLFFNTQPSATAIGKPLSASSVNSRFQYYRTLVQPPLPALDFTAYGLKVEGVSQAVKNGVNMRLIQRHGNWKSDAVFEYIRDDEIAQLSVTRAL
jgi:hypothetical protein